VGAAGIALAAFVIAVIAIRIRREDMAGPAATAPERPASAERLMDTAHT
jgi:hypothetical protein